MQTARNVGKELSLLSSNVGIPAKILTVQGTLFMSCVMMDLCHFLQPRTSIYHAQMNCLVEHFNQTLKMMLKRVVAEDGRDWDLMLPYVLSGIREVPQASTSFTTFELLFRCQPQGLLDVAVMPGNNRPLAPTHRNGAQQVEQVEPVNYCLR